VPLCPCVFQFTTLPWELLRFLFALGTQLLAFFQVGKLRPFSYILLFHVVWLSFQFCVVGMILCWFGTHRSVVWNGGCHYCRKTVARPANLAQASQSHLGEMGRGSPKPFYARGRPGDPLSIFERASVSPRREGSRLGETPRWFLDAYRALA